MVLESNYIVGIAVAIATIALIWFTIKKQDEFYRRRSGDDGSLRI
jgi:hypothetical protein